MDWGIITDHDLPDILIRNIEWVHKEYDNDDVSELGVFVIQNLQKILSERLSSGENIARGCSICDEQLGLEIGTSLALFRHFITRKMWSVNMSERIIPSHPAKAWQKAALTRLPPHSWQFHLREFWSRFQISN
ncbi:hypothetical protein GCM10010912_04040 [Paenibacillus albidus]|uniref:TnsA endonuclease C-terminal domain-containing protein n=1 Tax=Paenibacillus albidus TaxID=2041023 RepID=A0A917BXT0_9BACL|nr:hypothetical protein GCM10010912_04040 [Paenibacillus albidus]